MELHTCNDLITAATIIIGNTAYCQGIVGSRMK